MKISAKKIATVGLAVSLMAMSVCSAHHVDNDKYAHIGACTAAGIVLAQNKPFNKWKPWQRALFNVVVIGGGKEWYDSRHPSHHSAEWGDIGADAIGALTAEGCVWLIHKSF